MPSLQSPLIAYQDEARIEVSRRDAGWTMRDATPDESVAVPKLGGALPVRDAYDRVTI